MERFYFTYGTKGQPYRGGWTTVEAPDRKIACALFRVFHPGKVEGVLNCACVYTAEQFWKTRMYKEGNFGAYEQERITFERTAGGGNCKEATR